MRYIYCKKISTVSIMILLNLSICISIYKREREVGWGGIVLTWELIITAHSISLWLFAYQF